MQIMTPLEFEKTSVVEKGQFKFMKISPKTQWNKFQYFIENVAVETRYKSLATFFVSLSLSFTVCVYI